MLKSKNQWPPEWLSTLCLLQWLLVKCLCFREWAHLSTPCSYLTISSLPPLPSFSLLPLSFSVRRRRRRRGGSLWVIKAGSSGPGPPRYQWCNQTGQSQRPAPTQTDRVEEWIFSSWDCVCLKCKDSLKYLHNFLIHAAQTCWNPSSSTGNVPFNTKLLEAKLRNP